MEEQGAEAERLDLVEEHERACGEPRVALQEVSVGGVTDGGIRSRSSDLAPFTAPRPADSVTLRTRSSRRNHAGGDG